MTERLIKYFGKDFTEEQRKHSYDYIEIFISECVKDWSTPPDTDVIAAEFASKINQFSKEDFAFLLSHAGYIPEFYEHDSSQETLYSKLIEVLVCEWALRIGFNKSAIQKQKASKEDVTIQRNETVIVCDAKSFRLGRSQAAPNVKDTIKKADYEKWQDHWNESEPDKTYGKLNSIGGLITFPSLHRWKGKSDAYLYCTDADRPIAILFYEHLAYFLLKEYDYQLLIDLFTQYPALFPHASRDQKTYFDAVLGFLFGTEEEKERHEDFYEYTKLSLEIVKEKVKHTIDRIDIEVIATKHKIELEIEAIDVNKLKQALIESRLENESGQLIKQLINIKKFRPV